MSLLVIQLPVFCDGGLAVIVYNDRKDKMKDKKKKQRQDDLPDYTVAHMDVDGMPWNSKRPWQILPGDPDRESRKKRSLQYAEPVEADRLQDGEGHSGADADDLHAFLTEQKQDELTGEERRSLVWLALKASLTVGGVFVLAAFLFILFCVKIWLR